MLPRARQALAREEARRAEAPHAREAQALIGAASRPHVSLRGKTPVFPIAQERDGRCVIAEAAAEYIRTPEHLENTPGVVGLVIRRADMAPMYRPGDVVVVNPYSAPQAASGVALFATQGAGVLIREYVSETETEWLVQRHGADPAAERVSKDDYPMIAVVRAVIPGR